MGRWRDENRQASSSETSRSPGGSMVEPSCEALAAAMDDSAVSSMRDGSVYFAWHPLTLEWHPRNETPRLMTTSLRTICEGSLARITLNRPHRRNAFDQATTRSLMAALDEVANRGDLAVVVLEGAGDHFCAGWDLSEFGRLAAADDEEVANYMVENVRLLRRVAEIPQFTVALVQGYAIGFGAALAMSADLAVADPGARFYFPEADMGVVPAVVLPALVESLGVGGALLSVLCSGRLPAEEALAAGMIGMVAGSEAREEMVKRLAGLSPSVVRATKGLAVEIANAPFRVVEDRVAAAALQTIRSAEARRHLGTA